MKEFSHPGTKDKTLLDLNHAIQSTITVSRNEWKYVAEMETEYDSTLPMISCLAGEFNQLILNLIVNAAHAIADVVQKGDLEKGKNQGADQELPGVGRNSYPGHGHRHPRKGAKPSSSIPSSPLKRLAKGPGRAWPSHARWSLTNTVEPFTSKLRRGRAQPLSFVCLTMARLLLPRRGPHEAHLVPGR